MKKKLLAILLTVCMVLSMAPAALAAGVEPDTTWYDTSATTYEIDSAAELAGLANLVNSGTTFTGKTVKLTANIDLSGIENWTPIGTESNKFAGIFDGNGNTISGLKITTDVEGAGLFGYTSGTANDSFDEVSDIWSDNTLSETAISESNYTTVIKNLKLANVTVVGKERVGALIGRAANTYIFDCDVISGSVSGVAKMGGLIGQIDNCVVKNCDNAASVTGSGEYNYGGVIGTARGGSANAVIGCNNTGVLSFSLTNGGAGGVLGQYSESALVVYNCTNSGVITLQTTPVNNTNKGAAVVGGIVGTSGGGSAVIANCANSGNITNTSNNISGQMSGIASNIGGLIYNCTNSGDISGKALYVGGICAAPGYTPVEVSACTNSGTLTNANVSENVSTIVAYCAGSLTYSNMEFENAEELAKALPSSAGSSVILTDTVTVAGENFGAVIEASGNLTVTGDNAVIEIPTGSNIQKLTITGDNATVTNNGTIATLTCNETCTVTNNGTINSVQIAAENCTVINSAEATMGSVAIAEAGVGSTITNNGTLNGSVAFYADATVINNGTINVTGHNITMRIWEDGVTATVNNNGTISNPEYYVYWIEVNNAKFIVTDGESAQYSVASESNIERVVGTVSGSSIIRGTAVAKIGDVSYGTLAAAIEAANNSTITLLTDITLTGEEMVVIPAGKTVTLNMAGYDITGAADQYALDVYGKLILTGTADSIVTGGICINDANSEVVMDTVTVQTLATSLDGMYNVLNYGGKFTMNSGKLYVASDSDSLLLALWSYGGTTVISGGEIVSDDTHNKAGDDANYAIVATDSASVTLENVQVTGAGGGVCANGNATVTINSGNITAGLFHSAYAGTGSININDGTFNGSLNSNVTVSGGTFDTDPVSYVASGYCVKDNNTTYTVAAHSSGTDDGDCTTAVTCPHCGEEATAAKAHDWSNKDGECANEGCDVICNETHATGTTCATCGKVTPAPYIPVAPTTYSVTVEDVQNGDVAVSPSYASPGSTVTITVDPDDGYKLSDLTVLDKNGKEIELTAKGNGKYTFKMPSGKVTVEATFVKAVTVNPFVDVAEDAYYYDAVLWAVENEITTGTGADTFSPNAVCTRAQVVTFLWRAAGCPEPVGAANEFADVDSNAYYAKAVQWAVEQGITLGTGDNKFSPDAECTRGQIVTFLWRSQGSENAPANNPFVDVADGAYYEDAVLWAVEEAITNGTGADTFSPDADCTRGQIVTFLYRSLAE